MTTVSNGSAGHTAGTLDSARTADLVLDACGLECPMPLMKAKKGRRDIAVGQTLLVLATDPGSWRDFAVFAEQSGHGLLEASEQHLQSRYLIQRRI